MNNFLQGLLFAVAILSSTLLQASGLTVSDAWIREAPPVSKVQAAYMLISNSTETPVTLVAATSTAYSKIEFHRTVMDNGVMRMLQENNLSIPAKNKIHLKPEGTHMMLFNPVQPLKDGDKVRLTLIFSNQQQLDVTLTVKKAMGEMHHHHDHR